MSDTHHSDALLPQAAKWLNLGRKVVLATVVKTWGSSPRGVGAHLIVDETGTFMGSVSGGCIEGSVITEAEAILAGAPPKLVEYGVSQERAWQMGLSCGGQIQVHLQKLSNTDDWKSMIEAMAQREATTLVTRLTDGAFSLVRASGKQTGTLALDEATVAMALTAMHEDRAMPFDESLNLFLRPYNPPLRLVVVGGVHIAQALLPMASLAGFATLLVDPRRSFASEERFPGVPLIHSWPEEALASIQPDYGTAIVTLTHDPKLDDPAIIAALRSPAYYVGALGSKRTHEKRLQRLAKSFDDATLKRIHAPVGLDLGGRSPQHIAVSILAQIVEKRFRPDR